MVCVTEEESVICCVHNDIAGTTAAFEDDHVCDDKSTTKIQVCASNNIAYLHQEICKAFDLEETAFELFLRQSDGDDIKLIPLSDSKQKLLIDVGVVFDKNINNYFVIRDTVTADNCNGICNPTNGAEYREDDYGLSLGASASPTAIEGPPLTQGPSEDPLLISVLLRQDAIPYVGLVNQAMTCYLNSLLQALYMTPEFRNALYNWVFDGCDQAKSIPYQLQKLFLNLQTSAKSAVETTELTRSFGWDLSEAWQQHDIQELCRVMFDALEQKFKDTDQADLINRLYQGKMIDYVKCLECKTEKSREDTFLDIPLPVRPFGSTVAYGSVEEALRAFVQPETLDGNNQYHCDKCNKKCDAHKGLKFSTIPYLLTLHLKRFDFDYSTMHRIKLNDKVTFPETLDLNSFVTSSTFDEATFDESLGVKCDDSSTTDSGSALDDESATDLATAVASGVIPAGGPISSTVEDGQDDDEGIDVSSGTTNENEKNRRHNETKGPYVYELFSIMIHSGSASGGHYYAYIKDFRKGNWFCFDDQTVSIITYDDIRKTYGGGPLRSYYSGAYSSSTNAYMLMYRQVDPERNVHAITAEEFPPHIKQLLQSVREREEYDRINRERELVMCKLKVYVNHPTQNELYEAKLFLHLDSTLTEATQEAYRKFQFENVLPIEQCRLVSYNKPQDTIECSFEGRDDEAIGYVLASLKTNIKTDWLLELRAKDEQFQEYQPGGVNLKVFVVNLDTEDVSGPVVVRGYEAQTCKHFKLLLAKTLSMNEDTIQIALESYNNGSAAPSLLNNDDNDTISQTSLCSAYKVYVANQLDEDHDKPFIKSTFHKIIDKFEHIISLEVLLPVNDKNTLDVLSIPPLDQSGDAGASGEPSQSVSPKIPRVSPVQAAEDVTTAGHSDQSNSEDSSLSDSDRTLVGDAPDECLAQLSSNSNSPAASDQHLSSPEDAHNVFMVENWDEEVGAVRRTPNFYFKAIEVPSSNDQFGKTLKVLVDKRTNLVKLKQQLEPYVGVPMEYFKIYRQYSSQEIEYSRPAETLNLSRDGEKLTVKLGRVLKENEHAGKVFQLTPNATETTKFLCDWVIARGATVAQVKRELLEALRKQYQMEIPFERCRLRKKNWKNPNKIYLNDQKFMDDILLHANWEIFVQELTEPEPLQTSDELMLFVRQWCPSTMELKPFQEVSLEQLSVAEFKDKLSTLSGVPAEYIEITILKGTFPYEISVLGVHNDLEWHYTTVMLNDFPFHVYDDGHAFLFRDNREQLKQLSPDERKEISNKESSRINRFSSKSSLYSPRKERALKIYLDTSPKKSEDPEVD